MSFKEWIRKGVYTDVLDKLKDFVMENITILFLSVVILLLFFEPWTLWAESITSLLYRISGIELVFLGERSLENVTLYICSALIQTYAALVAIIYSLISIHLQTRYGYIAVHALIKRFIKPLIVLALFFLISFIIMLMNSSEALSLTVKHILLIVMESSAFIASLIFLYTHVIATAKLNPSRIVLELLRPKLIENLLKKASQIKTGGKALIELRERFSGSFTILRILLEDLSNVEESEAVMNAIAYTIQETSWHKCPPCINTVDHIVDNVDRKIKPILVRIVTTSDEAPSSTNIGNLLGTIAGAYTLVGNGYNIRKYLTLTNMVVQAYTYRSPLASATKVYPEEIAEIYRIIFAHIILCLEKNKVTSYRSY